MRRLLSILFLLISTIASAQRPGEPVVTAQALNSKFQFVNKQTGIPVNGVLFDETDPFINGYARVFLNNKFSFVNSNGKLIHSIEFEDARNFSNELAAVKKDGKWGFINGSGKIVIDPDYEIVFDFEGSVSVTFGNKKWLLINDQGKTIKTLDITSCYGFKNGTAKITRNGIEGLMDPNGEIVFNQQKNYSSKPIIPWHPNSANVIEPCPDNIDFEYGSFLNWQCYTGQVDSVGNTNVITVVPSPPTANRHTLYSKATPSALDPYGLFPTNPPDGSNYAVKLGNTNVGAQAERITYTIRVPLNDSNFSIKYDYAVVLQDPGHTIWTQPRFNAMLLDSATNTYISCASFEYISTSNLPGFAVSTVDPSVIYKPWSSVFFSLRGYGGKTLYLEFTTADCVRRAHWGYAYVDVESTCGQAIDMQYDCTFPNITTLTGPPGFQTYNWWDQNYTTILGTGQQLILNPGPVVNSIIWLEMIPFTNFGCTDTLMVRINGDLNPQFDMSDTVGCAPSTFTFYNRNLPSTTTLWDFGDGNTGTGDTVTHTYNLPGTYTVTLNVTVPSGCNGTATHQVVINPTPNVVQPANQNLCNGATTNAITFSGSVSGTTFSWTNNNTSIGLAASGNGNIAAFTATNTSNAPVIATITVTPIAAGCSGTPKTFTITVNPVPNVVQPASQTLCNGATTNAITFAGSVGSSSFNWTNNNTAVGLAASGSGNIAAFTATNTSNAAITATITVTPFAAGCPGTPESFSITVNPTPTVVQPADQNLCNGATTNAITFAGAVSGTTFSWTNNNTSVGLAASGNGNIAAFTATNTTNAPITATITVSPSAAGCPGTPKTFTITVNPTPDLVQPTNQTLCNGSITNAITFAGSVTNTSFNWTNDNSSVGLAASGTGNIAAFTAVNTTSSPVTATITVTPSASGCAGTPQTFTVTVNPTPDVVQPADQILCNAATTNAITFTGAVSGTTFSWTNTNTSIGLAASGNGNIPAFTAINTTNAPVTATITVTPSASGCPGTPKTFTITVNPIPNVVQPADQTICNGSTTNAIIFTGSVNNTSYNWTNNNASVGLAASGSGNIAAFIATNTTSAPVTATITVTPTAAGCPGTPQIFTITVNPTPNVVQPPNQTLCNGATTNAIIFSGSVSGTLYSWINTAASIGLPAAGTGNIPPFIAYSNGYSVSVATITVTPSALGCTGNPERFTITINPTPNVVQPVNQALCNGATTNTIIFSGAMNSAVYSWSNSDPSIGLASTGTGNINGFTAVNTGNTPITATITVTPSTNICTGIPKTFTITVNPTPSVNAGVDRNVCLGNTVQLTATGASQYSWSPSTRLSCVNCPNPVSTPTDNIRYIVRGVSAAGCMANDTVLLSVIKPFQMQASPNDTLCIGESAILGASGANSYLWSPPVGLDRTDIASPRATPNTTTVYRVVGYDGYNCFTDTNYVRIVVGPRPTLNLGPDQTLSTGNVIHLNPVFTNGPIVNWTWTPSPDLSCLNCPTPIATVRDNTYYTLSVTNNFGCTVRDTIFIFVFCKSAQVFIPNAFTPDGDGLNDILMVRGKGITVKTFRIFNRWGELVFEKTNFSPNDPKYGWDGKVRGVPATPDVFVYTAEVICDNNILYTYKGNTTLLK